MTYPPVFSNFNWNRVLLLIQRCLFIFILFFALDKFPQDPEPFISLKQSCLKRFICRQDTREVSKMIVIVVQLFSYTIFLFVFKILSYMFLYIRSSVHISIILTMYELYLHLTKKHLLRLKFPHDTNIIYHWRKIVQKKVSLLFQKPNVYISTYIKLLFESHSSKTHFSSNSCELKSFWHF